MDFDEIVERLDLEPPEVGLLREVLKADRDYSEHRTIDAVVDELRDLWGRGTFDKFCRENIEGDPKLW